MSVPAPEQERAERERLAQIADDAARLFEPGWKSDLHAIAALLREARPPEGELPEDKVLADSVRSFRSGRDFGGIGETIAADVAAQFCPHEHRAGSEGWTCRQCLRIANEAVKRHLTPERVVAIYADSQEALGISESGEGQPPNLESAGLPRLTAEPVLDDEMVGLLVAGLAYRLDPDAGYDHPAAVFCWPLVLGITIFAAVSGTLYARKP